MSRYFCCCGLLSSNRAILISSYILKNREIIKLLKTPFKKIFLSIAKTPDLSAYKIERHEIQITNCLKRRIS